MPFSEKLKKLGVHLNSKRQKFFSEDQDLASVIRSEATQITQKI